MSRRRETAPIPTTVSDTLNGVTYKRLRYLGKGGFARCYEFQNATTGEVVAGKVVSKSLLTKPHQKEKMMQEIALHKTLQHRNVVMFKSSFQDPHFVYITLEICKKQSLMELHKRRGPLTEPEVRYYMKQIGEGMDYLHNTMKIIHRDLKLGNIFINSDMVLKLGDLGLATRINSPDERKRTLCGTPNYIAPEILVKSGHSFEVDMWSSGCIMYTLLVGKPPFETSSLKETYSRIKRTEYVIPEDTVGPAASNLITSMLMNNPKTRITATKMLQHEFLTEGYLPKRLPTSSLTVRPHFTERQMTFNTTKKPLIAVDNMPEGEDNQGYARPTIRKSLMPDDTLVAKADATTKRIQRKQEDIDSLYELLQDAILNANHEVPELPEDAEHPASSPVYWISKWVDYSDKYGIGFMLCDNSVGVLFNDATRAMLHANAKNMQYLDKEYQESFFTKNDFPQAVKKKVSLVDYFRKYMIEHLLKAGAAAAPKEGDELSRLPYLRTWFRTRTAICLWLSNGSMQVNWFESHEKVIFCPKMKAVTLLNQDGSTQTFLVRKLHTLGITNGMMEKIKYAKQMVRKCKEGVVAEERHHKQRMRENLRP
ncbi:Oidioi.mRNA.OKI2018_I69.XSR.g16138.t1.cds [Oikopleura dioica]|uniref:Serine/threonine-protein kinase PLK n=1 Tax=Oikopleura dioica TaxID=34765 RepID=A0ABN7SGZ3_OIKDI|nr:Oidioi.mRNA.OKI2018_I69.XSR.g16138.t1.cds [Oikopleura dioica]